MYFVYKLNPPPKFKDGNISKTKRNNSNDQIQQNIENDERISIFSTQPDIIKSNNNIESERKKMIDESFDVNEPYKNLFLHKIPRDRFIDDEQLFLHDVPKTERTKYLNLRNMILLNWPRNKIMTFKQLLNIIDKDISLKENQELVLKNIWKFLYDRLYITNILNSIDDPLIQNDIPYGFNHPLPSDYGNIFNKKHNRFLLIGGSNNKRVKKIANGFNRYGLNDIIILQDDNYDYQITKKFPDEQCGDLLYSNNEFNERINDNFPKVVIPIEKYPIPNVEVSNVSIII